jgi:hypothetical protein
VSWLLTEIGRASPAAATVVVPVVVVVTADGVGVSVVDVARVLVVADASGLAGELQAAADTPIRMDAAMHDAPRENCIRTR